MSRLNYGPKWKNSHEVGVRGASKRGLAGGLTVAVALAFGAFASTVRADDLLGTATTTAGSAVAAAMSAAPAVSAPTLPPVPSPTPTTAPVQQTGNQATSTASQAAGPVAQTAKQVKTTVHQTTQTVTKTAQTVTKPVVKAASEPVQTATKAVDSATRAATPTTGSVQQAVNAVTAPVQVATRSLSPSGAPDRTIGLALPMLAGRSGTERAATPTAGSATLGASSAATPTAARLLASPDVMRGLNVHAQQASPGNPRASQHGAAPPLGTIATSSGVDVIRLVPVAGARSAHEPQQNLLLREFGGVSALWLGSLGFLGLALVLTRSAAHQLGRRLFPS